MSSEKTYTLNLTTAQLVALQMSIDTRLDWLQEQRRYYDGSVVTGHSEDDNEKMLAWLEEQKAKATELKALLQAAR